MTAILKTANAIYKAIISDINTAVFYHGLFVQLRGFSCKLSGVRFEALAENMKNTTGDKLADIEKQVAEIAAAFSKAADTHPKDYAFRAAHAKMLTNIGNNERWKRAHREALAKLAKDAEATEETPQESAEA